MQKTDLKKLGNKVTYSDQYDPNQLEVFKRVERRIGYTAPMNGYDIWTAYEFSFLLPSGLPDTCVLRIYNPATSEQIFESKSLKLYLNSFNNTKFQNRAAAIKTIERDLNTVVGSFVKVIDVQVFPSTETYHNTHYQSQCLEYIVDDEMRIEKYSYDKSLLITRPKNLRTDLGYFRSYYSDLLRSNCELTNQPDFGRVFINYLPNEIDVDPISLLKYIVSYRNHNEFHEPTCERIYNDLFEILQPKLLTVICQYTRRGGIDINPIRSTDENANNWDYLHLPKLLQQ